MAPGHRNREHAAPQHVPLVEPLVVPLVVSIVGPTASGKSRLALDLASFHDVEIINADSRAFYRGMDIGTAKPSQSDRRRVPHHLIDTLDPWETTSLAEFQDAATSAIADTLRRGRLPLLVGGTPQYFNSVIEGWIIPRVPPDDRLRQELQRRADADGVETLIADLQAVDPLAADRNGRNTRRIIRALEVFAATGIPISAQQGKQPVPFRTLDLYLSVDRPTLHARIAARVERMLTDGLVDELRRLLAAGVPRDAPALSAIGYRQLFPFLDGLETLDAARARIVVDTNRFVRHQETWFRRNDRLLRLDGIDPDLLATARQAIRAASTS